VAALAHARGHVPFESISLFIPFLILSHSAPPASSSP
jgi:hypothetical protein